MSFSTDTALAELWEATSRKLRDEYKVANRLEELLRRERITEKSMILDAAGGFGFPSIELAKRGYQIIYSDGSQGMLEHAMRNADLAGAPAYLFSYQSIGYGAVSWQQFAEAIGSECFNALICTGNSLPYVATWGKDAPDNVASRKQILSVLKEFYRIIAPNGILYVDKQPEAQDRAVEGVGAVEVNGKRFYLSCSFDNDKVHRIRNWTLTTKDLESGAIKAYPSRGYLLLEDELVPLLHRAGFSSVSKTILEGDVYEGFVAKKKR
ncbi:MAG TPA: class I SAM-dependent methyltransferase [Candidatus Nanoarchaeia archaeon]|nr:class I SAM-dependent methyltransferase [Candidatus Nanoarchaeia archaeon]